MLDQGGVCSGAPKNKNTVSKTINTQHSLIDTFSKVVFFGDACRSNFMSG